MYIETAMKTSTCIRSYLLLICVYALLTGCAAKTVEGVAPIHQPSVPAKQLPERVKIPRTQFPYEIMGKTYYPIPSAFGFIQEGVASWYGPNFHGHKTSNGETYDMHAGTAAHKTLPMNTELLVENLENGKKTFVRVNDRGPFAKGRIIDLSYTAAKEIGIDECGTSRVRITALGEAIKTKRGAVITEHFLPYGDFNQGEFFVQIGSFTQKENAERLKQKMLGQGNKTVIQPYASDDIKFFRVQIRAGNTLTAAKHLEKTIERSFPGAFVIAR
jgi:rare lipoprotein A